MLGELLGEDRGQITYTRVLPTEPGRNPKVEISFEANGVMLGVSAHEIGTYCASPRPDGTLFGEGQGVLMSPQGDMATWRGQGVGRMTESGGTEFRGAIYFETASERWARLNSIAGVYEYSADESGKTETKLWEWC